VGQTDFFSMPQLPPATQQLSHLDFLLEQHSATGKAPQCLIFVIDFILLFCFRHLGEGTGEQQRVGRVAERGRINWTGV